ncbi:MAG: hypothetical protein AB1Z23_09495 [Eubacteriales bacterium]
MGIIDNLENALQTWNDKLADIWSLLTQSPQNFKGGAIWSVMLSINGALQAIGYALLVLFFVTGVIKTTTNFHEIKRPEVALRLFIRFANAKAVVTWGMDIMLAVFDISQGVITTAAGYINSAAQATLPTEMVTAVEGLGFFESIPVWAVSLIGSLFIVVLSFIMIMTVYSRFFKLYMYTAIAPIPLSSFASETTSSTGIAFLKSYMGVCLEGAIIVIACIIFSAFASSAPNVDLTMSATKIVWAYMGELIFNLLVLVGAVKMSDRIVKEMLGL